MFYSYDTFLTNTGTAYATSRATTVTMWGLVTNDSPFVECLDRDLRMAANVAERIRQNKLLVEKLDRHRLNKKASNGVITWHKKVFKTRRESKGIFCSQVFTAEFKEGL